jgi:S1-C subfamily serine protease
MLNAKNCGGPLVNLQGQVIGVNIARAGRVASYSLPVSTIGPIIDQLKTGELAPAIVNKEEIAKIDTERQELTTQLGDLSKRREKVERKLSEEEIRLDAYNKMLKDFTEKQKAQEAVVAKQRRAVGNVKEESRRTEKVLSRLDSKRKLLATGRQ